MALGDEARDDGRRGQCERRSDDECPGQAQSGGQPCRTQNERAEDHLDRAEPKDIARLRPEPLEGEMKSDVKEEEDHAHLGKRRDGGAVVSQIQTRAAKSYAQKEVAHDRAHSHGARRDRGDDAQ